MDLPPISIRTRERPAASGQARRRSIAASASSSASSSASNPSIVIPSALIPSAWNVPRGTVSRGTGSWGANLDEGAALVEIEVAAGVLGQGVRGGQREDAATRPGQSGRQRQPLVGR